MNQKESIRETKGIGFSSQQLPPEPKHLNRCPPPFHTKVSKDSIRENMSRFYKTFSSTPTSRKASHPFCRKIMICSALLVFGTLFIVTYSSFLAIMPDEGGGEVKEDTFSTDENSHLTPGICLIWLKVISLLYSTLTISKFDSAAILSKYYSRGWQFRCGEHWVDEEKRCRHGGEEGPSEGGLHKVRLRRSLEGGGAGEALLDWLGAWARILHSS